MQSMNQGTVYSGVKQVRGANKGDTAPRHQGQWEAMNSPRAKGQKEEVVIRARGGCCGRGGLSVEAAVKGHSLWKAPVKLARNTLTPFLLPSYFLLVPPVDQALPGS